jgi:hypothetical protein
MEEQIEISGDLRSEYTKFLLDVQFNANCQHFVQTER